MRDGERGFKCMCSAGTGSNVGTVRGSLNGERQVYSRYGGCSKSAGADHGGSKVAAAVVMVSAVSRLSMHANHGGQAFPCFQLGEYRCRC